MKLIIILLITLFYSNSAIASDCHVVEKDDKVEVVCIGEPPPPPPPPPPKRNINDSKSSERKSAIKSLIRMQSQYSVGISYNKLNQLLSDALTEYKIYETTAKGLSNHDDALISLIGASTISYELALMEWKSQIDSRRSTNQALDFQLSNSSKLADLAIKYFDENWK